jgi:hypothetical protein
MQARDVREWQKWPRPKRKRVLLAWEHGAGRTHYSNLLAVASHLRASGIECLAALYDNSAADSEFRAIGVHTMQNFVWPSQRREQTGWRGTPVNSFTDYLANVGLNSSVAVASAIAHYEGLFSLFEPDLVVCEGAYGGILAAREHLPVVAMGFCVRLPPIVILSTWFETRIAGGFVKANDLGDSCQMGDATAAWVTAAVDRSYHEEALRSRSKAAAPRFRKWFDGDPTAIVAARVCHLLGVDFREALAPETS